MTTSYRAEIVVAAKQEATQALEQVAKSIKAVDKAADESKDHVKGFSGAFEKLTGVSLGAAAGVGGIALAVKGVADAVQGAAKWGDDMGDLATKTGMTVKQASTMAVVFGDVGLSMGTLEAAAKSAAKNGIEFNMETLKKLAAQYQAIEDPVKRSQFAMEKFGRAGLEMTEILSRDAANLDELGRAALYSGKVIDEQAAAAAEKFNTTMTQFSDKVEGAKIALGNALIPTLTNAADGFMSLLNVTQAVNIVIQKSTGLISDEEAAWKAQRLAAGDLLAAYQDYHPVLLEMTDRTKDDTVAVIAQRDAMDLAADEIIGLKEGADAFAADAALQKRLEDLTGAASDLKFGMGELTKELIFNTAAQGLDKDAAYELAKSMGLVSKESDAAKQTLDTLREKYDTNRDGAISAAEAAAGYARDVKILGDSINDLPSGKSVTIEYITQYRTELAAEQNRGAQRQGGAIGDGYGPGGANGLDFIVPPGYPNDTFPFRAQSGERVTVTPAGQQAPGKVVNYNLNVTTQQASANITQDFALMRAMSTVGV